MNITISDYKIITASTDRELTISVKDHIKDGWVPYGSPFVTVTTEWIRIFYQAVIRNSVT